MTALNEAGIESVLLYVTATGLKKSIMDATAPMRKVLLDTGFHNFDIQLQGQEHKVMRPALIVTDGSLNEVTVSLYRPVTKKGDPRLWVYNFSRFADPDDVYAVFIYKGRMHFLNLTASSLADDVRNRRETETTRLLRRIGASTFRIANELLDKLAAIAAEGPIRAVCAGDTAIGRSIETALGIAMNSSREPDYKGIEIKSGRSKLFRGRDNRATLFACVPDWQLSNLQSSEEILNRFGYQRNGQFRLYCTVSTRKKNSQGLQLRLDEAQDWLREFIAKEPIEEICIWQLPHLHQRLNEKHSETFWINADTTWIRSREHFILRSVTHTSKPSDIQFDRMLGDGSITLDHLIKRRGNGAHEKGPLFKVERKRLPELFLGQPREHTLTQ